ncbi:hypothetical protein ACRAWD_20035 [Caulobacter segnis]
MNNVDLRGGVQAGRQDGDPDRRRSDRTHKSIAPIQPIPTPGC